MLYEPDQLVSVRTFDHERTARSTLEVAMLMAGAEGGFLASFDKGQELSVVVAAGVDRECVLEEPRVARLCELAVETHEPVVREGLPAGTGLPRQGHTINAVALPLRLRLRLAPPGPEDGVERERRRFPGAPLVKPLGVLFLACPPGPPPSRERMAALAAFADHAGEVLTNARLYAAATRDPLTDLYRRPELEQLLAVEVTLARHTDTPVSLLMVDIDDLSRINREESRQRGDRVIARVARLVRAQVRDVDACVRYGGEEFAVILPGTDPDGALAAAERIRRAVAEYPGFGGVKVTVSIGAASFPYHAEGPAELLRKADQTLFVAKQEGGDKSHLWHRRIPRHALRSDKLMGIITGNQAQDYRNVAMLLDTVVLTNSLLEQKQVLRTLLDMLIQLAAAQRGVLYLEREGKLVVEVAQDQAGESIEPQAVCEAALERARRTGLPVAFLGDERDEPEELVEAARARGLERVICIPLTTKGRQLGCMYFDARSAREGEFVESDLIFMQALSRELGNAIEHARLWQENLEQKTKLEGLTARLSQQVQAQASELASMSRNLSQLKLRFNYDKIVGKSEAMQAVFALLDRVTDHDVPVLITGETGTGKELVARSLHFNGPRKDGPFVSVNCSAITESLMESELFGHVRGAFTGADRDKQGLFEQAHKGTIFLDEVQDMSPSLQRELLRVLQEGEIRRVGGKDIIKVDVRVISATNRDLRAMVKGEQFRQDLFYRLNVVSLELPPLRDRKEDLPLLIQRVLEEVKTPDGKQVRVDPEALRLLLRHDWPGNVRELKNFIEKTALLIEGDTIRPEHVRLEEQSGGRGVSKLFDQQYEEAKAGFAREYLKAVLARNGGVVTRAAAEAGIVRSSFHKMLRKHGLAAKDFGGAE